MGIRTVCYAFPLFLTAFSIQAPRAFASRSNGEHLGVRINGNASHFASWARLQRRYTNERALSQKSPNTVTKKGKRVELKDDRDWNLARYAYVTPRMIRTTCPRPIPSGEDVTIRDHIKAGGYRHIEFRWKEDGYRYKARWHTKLHTWIPHNYPVWRISRKKIGTPTREEMIRYRRKNHWVPTFSLHRAIALTNQFAQEEPGNRTISRDDYQQAFHLVRRAHYVDRITPALDELDPARALPSPPPHRLPSGHPAYSRVREKRKRRERIQRQQDTSSDHNGHQSRAKPYRRKRHENLFELLDRER